MEAEKAVKATIAQSMTFRTIAELHGDHLMLTVFDEKQNEVPGLVQMSLEKSVRDGKSIKGKGGKDAPPLSLCELLGS